jgi:hypothetical protein
MAINLSGSLVITGSILATQGITGSFSGNATSASYAVSASEASKLQGLGSASFAPAATFNTVSQSFATTSGSLSGRVSIVEGQDATTGSNTFTGVQYISEASNAISFTSTASLYTDGGLRVAKDSFVSGTAYFNNIIVYGTSSIEYITSSQVDIGANIITVNTDTPAVRFGGLSVFDSGSTQLTGSMLWDSETNHWVYSNPSGSSYSGGMIMSGPRAASLGTEQGTTNNALMKGQGGDHITSSQMIDDGTTVRIPGNLQVTGSLSGSSAVFSGTVIASNGLLMGNGGATATTNYLPKFTGASTIGNSAITDDGTTVTLVSRALSGTSATFSGTATATSVVVNNSGAVASYFSSSNGSTTSGAILIGANAGGDFNLFNPNATPIRFFTSGAEKMRLDASGNLGIGVTPSAWNTNFGIKVIDIANGCVMGANSDISLIQNGFFNSSNAFIYKVNDFATRYIQQSGEHRFLTAPSGTAGNTITFTQAMTLDANGRLEISKANSGGIGPYLFLRNNTSTATNNAVQISFAGNSGGDATTPTAAIRVTEASNAAATMAFYTYDGASTAERMRITPGGFVKASNTSSYFNASASFHELRSNVTNNSAVVISHTASSGPYGMSIVYTGATPNNTADFFAECLDTTTSRFQLRSNGGLANYQANNVNLSDERTKKDIIPLESYWDKFKAIEIVKFKYKDQTHDDFNIGVIAQQVEKVAPEFVDVDGWDNKPKLDEDGNIITNNEEPLKSIYTADLHHATIKVLQECIAKIEEQQAQIEELTQEVNTLKAQIETLDK